MSGLYTRWTEGRPDVAKYAYVVRSKTDVRTGPGPDSAMHRDRQDDEAKMRRVMETLEEGTL